MGCIYLVTNRINGKQYVGKTFRALDARRGSHEKSSKGRSRSYFHNALRKYGAGSFDWEEVYSNVLEEDINRLEIECIAWYGTKAPKGYNLTDGGGGINNPCQLVREKISKAGRGRIQSEETRNKRIRTLTGHPVLEATREKLRKAFTGKKMSGEAVEKTASFNRGKRRSLETRRKLSAALIGNQRWLDRKHTMETRIKISLALAGKKKTPEHCANISRAKRQVLRTVQNESFTKENESCLVV